MVTTVAVPGPDSAVRVGLTGDWRIGRLESQRALLIGTLQAGPTRIELDAADITHFDTLGLQLLAVFVQQCLRKHISVNWLAVSPMLQEGAARLGLGAILALPADLSA